MLNITLLLSIIYFSRKVLKQLFRDKGQQSVKVPKCLIQGCNEES